MRRREFLWFAGGVVVSACGGGDGERATPTTTRTTTPNATATATRTPAPTATDAPTATPTLRPPQAAPFGFPLDPGTRTGLVVGDPGARTIAWGEGPEALTYSRDDQPSADAERANRCGWNARTHVEYEGSAAVDWYIKVGTPIVSTMDGTATLYVNTISNAFDVYGVDREPYLGNPDRARAPRGPFPGPGGGMGAFVRVENDAFRTAYGHLDLGLTLPLVPEGAFLDGYGAGLDVSQFAPLRDFRVADAVARWEVKAGDEVGRSGDAGYSEAPHLHYTVARQGSATLLCPTAEPGFADGGWLFRE